MLYFSNLVRASIQNIQNSFINTYATYLLRVLRHSHTTALPRVSVVVKTGDSLKSAHYSKTGDSLK